MHYQPSTPLQEMKLRLRSEMREKRRLQAPLNPQSFIRLAETFLAHVKLEPEAIVSAYCAFRDEMDPADLIQKLRLQAHKIALPVIMNKREPLRFRLYTKGDSLITNDMGIQEPATTSKEIIPDVMLVPLLAFDRHCNRLGYGGGFYDRTVAALREHKKVITIGLAYSFQEVPGIPVGPYDAKLDLIVTDSNVFKT